MGREDAVIAVAVEVGRKDEECEAFEELQGERRRTVVPSGVGWGKW